MTYSLFLMPFNANILFPQKHKKDRSVLNKSIEPYNSFKDT